ncbi:MAG: LysM domain-containing protein [Propionibacterium sp.]|nr:LysM domain-containing protein [Propionibacterium sp.]
MKAGDTLSAIAQRHNIQGGWKALWQKNRATVSNPNLILVDQVIHL